MITSARLLLHRLLPLLPNNKQMPQLLLLFLSLTLLKKIGENFPKKKNNVKSFSIIFWKLNFWLISLVDFLPFLKAFYNRISEKFFELQ